MNSTYCTNCSNLPDNAFWTIGPGCSFDCKQGYTKPDCLLPFDQVIKSMGGPLWFGVILTSAVLLGSLPFIYCFWRRRRQKELKARVMEGGFDSNTPLDGNFSKLQDQKYQRLESLEEHQEHHEDEKVKAKLLRSVLPEELPLLMHRIYLHGSNTPYSPLHLDVQDAPTHIGVHVELWTTFASNLNNTLRWKPWEKRLFYFLQVVYCPVGLWFLFNRQSDKVLKARNFLMGYNHEFFKNHHIRILSSSLRLGFSKCDTYAWLDIVAPNIATKISVLGKSMKLPLTLICSGSGTFLDPYYLDVQDVLVQSLVNYFGRSWGSCLSHLNTHLRTVRTGDYLSLTKAFDYLAMVQHGGVIGLGAFMPLEGLVLSIGVRYSGQSKGNPDGAEIPRDWRPVVMLNGKFDSFSNPTHPKLHRLSNEGHVEDSKDSRNVSIDKSEPEHKWQKFSSFTKLSVSEPDGDDSLLESEDEFEVEDNEQTRLTEHDQQALRTPIGKRKTGSLLRRALGSWIKPMDAKQSIIKKLAEPLDKSDRNDAMCHSIVSTKDVLVFSDRSQLREYAGVSQRSTYKCQAALQNSNLTSRPYVVAGLSVTVLIGGIFAEFYVESSLFLLKRQYALIPILVLPFMPFVAQFSSLFGMALSSPRVIRSSIWFWVFSILNAVLSLVSTIVSNTDIYAVLAALAQIVLTAASIWILRLYVSHVDFRRDIRYMTSAVKSMASYGLAHDPMGSKKPSPG